MQPLDRDIADCRALVVDGNPTSRSIIAAQLRDFGVGTVVQASKLSDARRTLEHREFDIVLCEQHFPGDRSTGQDLLDDLRRAQLMPYSTVFVMITGEASYAKVAEAAESALDGYLLKPHAATTLGERLRQARHRKKVLQPIFGAIEAGDFEAAARLCLQRFQTRSIYWLYAARIGAELLLRIGNHAAAQKLYDAVIAAQALPWARLGVARAQVEGGQPAAAMRTLQALTDGQPGYADAYDVMGQVQMEQGDFDQALATYRRASELTPNSLSRLQKQGMLAFYLGERDEAVRALERAATLGSGSKMFDAQSLVLLAFARFKEGDSKALQRCVANLSRAHERDEASPRLARFLRVAQTLSLMLNKQLAGVLSELQSLAREFSDTGFDAEAACNMLSLLAELAAAELNLDSAERWVDTLALRFCVSRSLADLLARAAAVHPPHAARVRAAHARLHAIAEQAMSHTLTGDPQAAVRALLAEGERTGNAKLINTAGLTLQRHRERIGDAESLARTVEALRSRFDDVPPTPPLGQSNGRSAGGLRLRSAPATTPAANPSAPASASAPAPASV
jgi:CheY-like chemotaxis protein